MPLMKHISLKTALLAGLLFLLSMSVAGSGFAREAGDRNAHLTTEDRALVDAVSAWFNGVETLKGHFDQQNQDGSLVGGDFYLRRPGRMRFEYAAPQKLTLLSDGLWVMLNDRELETVDRYPLRETPLWLILKKHVDLAKDAQIVRVDREGGLTGVTVRSDDNDAQGALTLVFVGDQRMGLDLRHWVIEDVQGNRTVVSLRQIEQGMALSPELFIPDEYEFGEDED